MNPFELHLNVQGHVFNIARFGKKTSSEETTTSVNKNFYNYCKLAQGKKRMLLNVYIKHKSRILWLV